MPSIVGSRAGNLPLPLTSFVGRRREVSDAKQMVSASRLVTLIGPGGVGKTRLALKVAADVRRAFNDRVWLVELDQLRDPALLVQTVAESLGLRDQSGRPPTAALEEYLAQRRPLLVLDNCEHLVDAVAVLADRLLHSCPQLRILATSREPLGIGGEATLAVPSLSVPDSQRPSSPQEPSHCEAVTLFAERAASAVPGFGLTADNRPAVVEICRRLDGLPLAIELAAVRLRSLSAQEIAHRLGDSYRLLTTGRRGAPTRQQTLRSCIQWSYDLCSPQEQLLWARLAVFAGGVELNAMAGVCAGDDLAAEDMLDLVASLVDKSILIRDEHGPVVRYRLLDTIREYGREKLHQTGEHAALRRRHRDWYEDLSARADVDWIGPRQVDWLTRLDREHPNIRAALEFSLTEPGETQAALRIATALFPYWHARGLLSEGRHWLDQALAYDTGLTVERSRALCRASRLAGLQGDLTAASALVEQGRELQLGDASARTQAMLASGYLALRSGDFPGAVVCFEEVLDTLGVEGDVRSQLEARYGLALGSGMLGDTARTAACHEEIVAITEPHSELWYRSHSLWNLGVVAWRQGDPRRAAELVEQGLRLTQAMDDTFGSVLCLDTLAWIAASEHNPRRAATLLGAAASLTQAMGTLTIPYNYPGLAAYHEQCERQTRRALGEQALQAAFSHGSNLSVDDAIAYALNEKPQAAPAPASTEKTTLTRREREVADLVAEGLTNKEIAARLVISQRTVETHVEHILAKLGFTSRTQIAAWLTQ